MQKEITTEKIKQFCLIARKRDLKLIEKALLNRAKKLWKTYTNDQKEQIFIMAERNHRLEEFKSL